MGHPSICKGVILSAWAILPGLEMNFYLFVCLQKVNLLLTDSLVAHHQFFEDLGNNFIRVLGGSTFRCLCLGFLLHSEII